MLPPALWERFSQCILAIRFASLPFRLHLLENPLIRERIGFRAFFRPIPKGDNPSARPLLRLRGYILAIDIGKDHRGIAWISIYHFLRFLGSHYEAHAEDDCPLEGDVCIGD